MTNPGVCNGRDDCRQDGLPNPTQKPDAIPLNHGPSDRPLAGSPGKQAGRLLISFGAHNQPTTYLREKG